MAGCSENLIPASSGRKTGSDSTRGAEMEGPKIGWFKKGLTGDLSFTIISERKVTF